MLEWIYGTVAFSARNRKAQEWCKEWNSNRWAYVWYPATTPHGFRNLQESKLCAWRCQPSTIVAVSLLKNFELVLFIVLQLVHFDDVLPACRRVLLRKSWRRKTDETLALSVYRKYAKWDRWRMCVVTETLLFRLVFQQCITVFNCRSFAADSKHVREISTRVTTKTRGPFLACLPATNL